MARLAKKAISKSSSIGKKTSDALTSKTERQPGLKASLLSRDVNEFLHAPKATKKEKREALQADIIEKAKSSSILASSISSSSSNRGKVGKEASAAQKAKRAEKQKRKREVQAKTFNSSVQGLLSGLPDLDDLKDEAEQKSKKKEQHGLRVKHREEIIKMDKAAFQRNLIGIQSASSDNPLKIQGDKVISANSPLARLGAIKERLAKSMGKDLNSDAMEIEK